MTCNDSWQLPELGCGRAGGLHPAACSQQFHLLGDAEAPCSLRDSSRGKLLSQAFTTDHTILLYHLPVPHHVITPISCVIFLCGCCSVVAHRLGHLLGGCAGGWRGLRLSNSSPLVSEERRPQLLFDVLASFLANLQNQFCSGKEQAMVAGEQQVTPSGRVGGSRECTRAVPTLPGGPRNLPGGSV